MLKNKYVKDFLGKLINGAYALEDSLMPAFPTINIRTATVSAKTADYTVLASDLATPTIFSNSGDINALTLTLPAVADSIGKVMIVHALAAQVIDLDPQAGEAVNYNGSAVVSKYARIAGVIGNFAELFCDGNQWLITRSSGVITKEA